MHKDERWPDIVRHLTSSDAAIVRVKGAAECTCRVLIHCKRKTIETDCRERTQRVWEKVIDGCAGCAMTINDCKAELRRRYVRLFDNVAIPSTYMAFTRGQRGERDGRMVIWGVSAAEGNFICENMRAEFQKQYKGKVECVTARTD